MISGLGALSRLGATATSLPEFPMAPPAPAVKPEAAQNGFGALLSSLAGSAVDTLKAGEAAALQGMQGAMPVQQVVEQVMAAERTLQAGIAIRDKLTSAFLDISRMQI